MTLAAMCSQLLHINLKAIIYINYLKLSIALIEKTCYNSTQVNHMNRYIIELMQVKRRY